jgi:hypothetical protein
MAEKLPDNETVTVEELAITNAYELSAMFNILERKGILTRAEVLEEIKKLQGQK